MSMEIADVLERSESLAGRLCDWSKDGEPPVPLMQEAAAELRGIAAEMARWDRNETRNCLNWGPCSRHDGRMGEPPNA